MRNKSNNAQIMYKGFCPYTIQNIYYFSLSNYNIKLRSIYIFITLFLPHISKFYYLFYIRDIIKKHITFIF